MFDSDKPIIAFSHMKVKKPAKISAKELDKVVLFQYTEISNE
jgi:hypothetical protein